MKEGVLHFRLDAYLSELTAEMRQRRDRRIVPRKSDLANAAGIHITTLARWSSGGIYKLDLNKLRAILDTLNACGFPTRVDDLLRYVPASEEGS